MSSSNLDTSQDYANAFFSLNNTFTSTTKEVPQREADAARPRTAIINKAKRINYLKRKMLLAEASQRVLSDKNDEVKSLVQYKVNWEGQELLDQLKSQDSTTQSPILEKVRKISPKHPSSRRRAQQFNNTMQLNPARSFSRSKSSERKRQERDSPSPNRRSQLQREVSPGKRKAIGVSSRKQSNNRAVNLAVDLLKEEHICAVTAD